MEKITLIREDFDLHTDEAGVTTWVDVQYTDARDCPIHRALTRTGCPVGGVTGRYVRLKDDTYIYNDHDFTDVKRCADEILAGAEETFIELQNRITWTKSQK